MKKWLRHFFISKTILDLVFNSKSVVTFLLIGISREYEHRKVWRHGLEVSIKIKGSQGHRSVEWLKPEHPYTAISDKSDIHTNHNEANNSALRRRCSAYRRRQNLYAKNTEDCNEQLRCSAKMSCKI